MKNLSPYNKFKELLFKPVDSSTLGLFRFFFGALLAWYAYQELSSLNVYIKYIQPQFFFHFPLFDWLGLKPLSASSAYNLFKVMGVSACCVALGIFYRQALFLFFVTYTYTFLIDKAYFNNHCYLIILLTLMLLLSSGERWASIDMLRKKEEAKTPIPFWQIFILRIQICIVYFYAGIAKLDTDFIAGRQMEIWLFHDKLLPFLPAYIPKETIILIFVTGSILVDLSLPFLLWIKRVRIPVFAAAIAFHIINKIMFNISIFHYLMIACLLIFLNPEEPRKWWRMLKQKIFTEKLLDAEPMNKNTLIIKPVTKSIIANLVIIYFLFQILIPLRHFIIPGNVNWTREGQRFSWRLKPNESAGQLNIAVINPKADTIMPVFPFEDLTRIQLIEMSTKPDMMLQYAHYLGDKYKKLGVENPVVVIDSYLSLNGRPYLPFIDRNVNLAEKEYKFLQAADWILPAPDDL